MSHLHLVVALVIFVVLLVVAAHLALRWRCRREAEASLRDAIFDYFALSATGGLTEVAVEADWLAVAILGHPQDTRIKLLPPAQQAKVVELSDEIVKLGKKLVEEDLLGYFAVTFENSGPRQKTNPPPTLFMLTKKGRALVLERQGRVKRPVAEKAVA